MNEADLRDEIDLLTKSLRLKVALQSVGAMEAAGYDGKTGRLDLGPKWVRLAPNGTNPGLFQIHTSH